MGAQEWLIIGGLALLFFGGSQIPKLARSLGQAQKEFKSGHDETVTKTEPSADKSAAAPDVIAKPLDRDEKN